MFQCSNRPPKPRHSGDNSIDNYRYAPHADMKATRFEYIEVFYNRKRPHSTLDYRSPIRFLEDGLSEQPQEKLVA